MTSEGELRAARIRRSIKDLAAERGESLQSLFEVAYLLVAAMACRDLVHDFRLSQDITELFHGDLERSSLRNLQVLTDSLSNSLGLNPLLDLPSEAAQWRSVAEVLYLVRREIDGLSLDGLREVLDMLFHELFALLSPSSRVHHAIVAHLARPLLQQIGSVVEIKPGPGELLIASGATAYSCADDHQPGLPVERLKLLRFIREIRFAVHGIRDALHHGETLRPGLCVQDRTLWFRRTVDDGRPRPPASRALLEDVHRLWNSTAGGALVILSHNERGRLHRSHNERRWLVNEEHLRALIAFPSVAESGKPTACTALYFHRHPMPGHEHEVAFLDLRQLHLSVRTEEPQHCAALAGTLIQSWHEGHKPYKEALEITQAPRRVLAFVEEGLRQTAGTAIPGFFRFVPLDEMQYRDYSLRVEDYIERRKDGAWRPKVQIDAIMERLSGEQAQVAVYLIGNNGAGKSLALGDVAMALAQDGRRSFGISSGMTDRFERSPSNEPLKSHFTYAGARTSKDSTTAKIAMGLLGDMVKEIYRTPHRLACFEAALGVLGFEPRQYLVRMATRSTADPLDLLLAEVHKLTHHDPKDEPASWRSLDDGQYKIALVRRESGEVVVFDALSSGEQQVLTMVVKIVAGLQPGTTVLLDEPEISPHVAWQRQLPQVLRIFSQALKCSFVVATHSPVLIVSATDVRDHCFMMTTGALSEIAPAERRSIEASLFEGFNTYTRHTHHIQERCAEIVSQVIAEGDRAADPSSDSDTPKLALNFDHHPQVQALVSLQKRLANVRGEGYEHDSALIKSAIAAVKEVLTP